jgi:aspartyl-tRNA(Asn)/glutamyl-tRNA(Gln) amidotransferase subunit C
MVALDVAERLTGEDVERIAALAHLELSGQEKDLFVRQLTEILGYAEQIQAVDTTGIPPTSHVLSRHPADRADEAQAPLPRADALANAPDPAIEAGLFRVPRVIG